MELNINIWDINGRMVKVLEKEHIQPGRNIIRWNGDTEDGTNAAAGVYFIRVYGSDFIKTAKSIGGMCWTIGCGTDGRT